MVMEWEHRKDLQEIVKRFVQEMVHRNTEGPVGMEKEAKLAKTWILLTESKPGNTSVKINVCSHHIIK